MNTVITGTGSYVPDIMIKNVDFNQQGFYDEKQQIINQTPEVITKYFRSGSIGSRKSH
jgi:3-oxoacyl-[acyl-carrier-protein] synthase-3